ncbi:hypothetical protein CKK34_6149 [Yarrowia sp. E02]|nr:hypothetical protein CKK34_6149 [Yarrowia sp. E02]
MLSYELVRLLFEYSNLENCVALSQVCGSYFAVWIDLDKSLVRKRVVERAPWFVELDEDCDSWRLAALLLTKRTEKALSKDNKHLYVVRDLSVAVSLCCNQTKFPGSVDFAQDEETRLNMDPLFDDAILVPSDVYTEGRIYHRTHYSENYHTFLLPFGGDAKAAITGTKLSRKGRELDLKTMKVSRSDFPRKYKIPYTSWYNEHTVAVSPSGLRVVNKHGQQIKVMEENDSLLLVRYWNGTHGAVTLVHKASHCQDDTGAYIVSSQHGPSWPFQETHDVVYVRGEGTPISLVPGAGGALALSNDKRNEKNGLYLFYVEPVPSLSQLVICELPRGEKSGCLGDQPFFPFFTCYKGYLYLHLEGRLLRLWIDLGMRTKVNKSRAREFSPDQVLTVWDRRFPAIGGFCDPRSHYFIQPFLLRKGRYITDGEAHGLVVGDLETGTTYFQDKKVLSIPFKAEDGSVGFCSLENWMTTKLLKKMKVKLGQISWWWDHTVIPQMLLGGHAVFTAVVRPDKVTDKPQEFEDEEREEDDALRVPEVCELQRYHLMYRDKKRPPLVLDASTLVSTEEFKLVEERGGV